MLQCTAALYCCGDAPGRMLQVVVHLTPLRRSRRRFAVVLLCCCHFLIRRCTARSCASTARAPLTAQRRRHVRFRRARPQVASPITAPQSIALYCMGGHATWHGMPHGTARHATALRGTLACDISWRDRLRSRALKCGSAPAGCTMPDHCRVLKGTRGTQGGSRVLAGTRGCSRNGSFARKHA